MEYKKFNNRIVVRFDKGEEIISTLQSLCEKEDIRLAHISAIGAVSSAQIGCFNTSEKKYYANTYTGIYEIGSLSGTVSTMDGKVYTHIHAMIAGQDNLVVGGHLNEAVVSATCEMIIDIIDGELGRAFSDEIGLNLFSF